MPTLFLSYAHEDVHWKDEVEGWLKLLALEGVPLRAWSDTELSAGENWRAKLDEVMTQAEVALLLVTRHFLGSDFIRNHELPYLDERERNQNLWVIPVIAEVYPPALQPQLLQRLQRVPAGATPLSGLPKHEKDSALSGLVEKLLERFGRRDAASAPAGHAVSTGVFQIAQALTDELPTLELTFRHRKGWQYDVTMRFSHPGRPERNRSHAYHCSLDGADFAADSSTPAEAAARLCDRVFPPGTPRATLDHARDSAEAGGLKLRVSIEPTARDLHALPWETLPWAWSDGVPVVVSRYASAGMETWPAPLIRSRRALRIGLASRGAKRSLLGLKATAESLRAQGLECDEPLGVPTVQDLTALRTPVTLLSVRLLWGTDGPAVEQETGPDEQSPVDGETLARQLRRLPWVPQVLVLDADADSADGADDVRVETALADLAADLVSAGVCAIVTRQRAMGDDSWQVFLAAFLSSLAESGNLDVAARASREAVEKVDERWKPLVLSRLRTGKTWFQPGFIGKEDGFWELLTDRVRKGTVVPVLAPGVSDYFTRSRREIAHLLAERCDYPVGRFERDNLPKVAQYIATMKERAKVVDEVVEAVREYAQQRHSTLLSDLKPDVPLQTLLRQVWDNELSGNPRDPYTLLAELGAPVYLTTTYNNLLSLAVAGRDAVGGGKRVPRDRILSLGKGILDAEADGDDTRFELSPDSPLVYYLFGRIDHPKTLVVTEDDHFRFLLNFKEQWASLPDKVRSALGESAFLFLGFGLDDWDFRALFRGFMELEGSDELRKIPHVAVQLDPDDDRLQDPERTRSYFIEYFNRISVKPRVYLGAAQDFLAELTQRLEQ